MWLLSKNSLNAIKVFVFILTVTVFRQIFMTTSRHSLAKQVLVNRSWV